MEEAHVSLCMLGFMNLVNQYHVVCHPIVIAHCPLYKAINLVIRLACLQQEELQQSIQWTAQQQRVPKGERGLHIAWAKATSATLQNCARHSSV